MVMVMTRWQAWWWWWWRWWWWCWRGGWQAWWWWWWWGGWQAWLFADRRRFHWCQVSCVAPLHTVLKMRRKTVHCSTIQVRNTNTNTNTQIQILYTVGVFHAIKCKIVCIILYCWSPTWERLWSNFTDCIAHIKIATSILRAYTWAFGTEVHLLYRISMYLAADIRYWKSH